MKKTVYWVSRHTLSPAQLLAITDLHGTDVKIVSESVVLRSVEGLADYIRSHPDGFVYAVAGAPHYLEAALSGLSFGVFENHPERRLDGTFGLSAVYHVVDGSLKKIWENPDPMSDEGERLAPMVR